MKNLTIKSKLREIKDIFLKRSFLELLIERSNLKYTVNDLVKLSYVSVVKKWKLYFNNQNYSAKNPYTIWSAYMQGQEFIFGWFDRYNKEGFSTQISNVWTVYNLKYSKEMKIAWLRFVFKKVKKEFLYGKKSKMINGFIVYFMDKERLFLEYVRDYLAYPVSYFDQIYRELDQPLLRKYAKKYPIKKVILKLNEIKNVSLEHK